MHDVLKAVEAGLDDVGEAIVVTDAHDRIAFATEAGRAALELVDHGAAHDRLPERAARHARARARRRPGRRRQPADGAHARAQGRRDRASCSSAARAARRCSLLTSLGLSPREAEVLQSMMRGNSTAAIAQQLKVTPKTVYKHAERIYAKFGVNDRIAAVSAAWAALDSGAEHRLAERPGVRNSPH